MRAVGKIPEELLGIKQPATEETLQSIDSTLKRIEKILTSTTNVAAEKSQGVKVSPRHHRS